MSHAQNRDYQGFLGVGTVTDQWSPAQVGTVATWTSAAAGVTHTVAIHA